jgi:serine/threonine-protein kinase
MATTGTPVHLLDSVGTVRGLFASYGISDEGTLAYQTTMNLGDEAELVRIGRDGRVSVLPIEPQSWTSPRLSPDGTRLLLRKAATPNCDLWIYDLVRGVLSRFTMEGDNHDPLWTPDGTRVTYCLGTTSTGGGVGRMLAWQPADGSTPPEVIARVTGTDPRAEAWSPDGRYLAFTQQSPGTGDDIVLVDMKQGRRVAPYLQTRFDESQAAIAPDGRWLAYASNESGRSEVYVRPFPGGGGVYQVSTGGANSPLWLPSGNALCFVSGKAVMEVSVETAGGFRAGRASKVFEGEYAFARVGNYAVTRDGKGFLIVRNTERRDRRPLEVHVVTDWFEELTKRVAGK